MSGRISSHTSYTSRSNPSTKDPSGSQKTKRYAIDRFGKSYQLLPPSTTTWKPKIHANTEESKAQSIALSLLQLKTEILEETLSISQMQMFESLSEEDFSDAKLKEEFYAIFANAVGLALSKKLDLYFLGLFQSTKQLTSFWSRYCLDPIKDPIYLLKRFEITQAVDSLLPALQVVQKEIVEKALETKQFGRLLLSISKFPMSWKPVLLEPLTPQCLIAQSLQPSEYSHLLQILPLQEYGEIYTQTFGELCCNWTKAPGEDTFKVVLNFLKMVPKRNESTLQILIKLQKDFLNSLSNNPRAFIYFIQKFEDFIKILPIDQDAEGIYETAMRGCNFKGYDSIETKTFQSFFSLYLQAHVKFLEKTVSQEEVIPKLVECVEQFTWSEVRKAPFSKALENLILTLAGKKTYERLVKHFIPFFIRHPQTKACHLKILETTLLSHEALSFTPQEVLDIRTLLEKTLADPTLLPNVAQELLILLFKHRSTNAIELRIHKIVEEVLDRKEKDIFSHIQQLYPLFEPEKELKFTQPLFMSFLSSVLKDKPKPQLSKLRELVYSVTSEMLGMAAELSKNYHYKSNPSNALLMDVVQYVNIYEIYSLLLQTNLYTDKDYDNLMIFYRFITTSFKEKNNCKLADDLFELFTAHRSNLFKFSKDPDYTYKKAELLKLLLKAKTHKLLSWIEKQESVSQDCQRWTQRCQELTIELFSKNPHDPDAMTALSTLKGCIALMDESLLPLAKQLSLFISTYKAELKKFNHPMQVEALFFQVEISIETCTITRTPNPAYTNFIRLNQLYFGLLRMASPSAWEPIEQAQFLRFFFHLKHLRKDESILLMAKNLLVLMSDNQSGFEKAFLNYNFEYASCQLAVWFYERSVNKPKDLSENLAQGLKLILQMFRASEVHFAFRPDHFELILDFFELLNVKDNKHFLSAKIILEEMNKHTKNFHVMIPNYFDKMMGLFTKYSTQP